MCKTCCRKWYNFTERHQRRPINREIYLVRDFPGGSVVKNSPANAGDTGSIPVSGRSAGEGNDNTLQYSCLNREAWQATVHRVTKRHIRLKWLTLSDLQSLFKSFLPHLAQHLSDFSQESVCVLNVCVIRLGPLEYSRITLRLRVHVLNHICKAPFIM